MDGTVDTPTLIAIAFVAVCVIAAAAGWVNHLKRRSAQLQQRFGPEYRRAVETRE